jgi:sugar lactone lactonase YvrE
MMTVSLRAAHPSQLRVSLAAVRSCLLLMLLAVFGGLAFGQSLTPGGPYNFHSVDLGQTASNTFTFTAPFGGTDIQSVNVVTQGATGKDFTLVSDPDCVGNLVYLAQCSITVQFAPTQIGLRLGALTIVDAANVVVNTVYLSGIGVGPQFVFAPSTAATTDTATGLTPANFTAGAAVQDGNGNLFFTDVANNRVLEESSTGLFSVVTSTLPLTATSGIAIDGIGNLYVSSGSLVYSIAPGSATPMPVLTPGITLKTPTGLAVDAAGDLYIADSTNKAVYQVPLGANTAAALSLTGPGATLSGPTGLAIDASGNLYIADSNNNRIVEVPLTTLVTTVVSFTSLTLNNPTGVAVDAAGTIYVANTGGSDVIESTVTGAQFVLTDPGLTLTTPAGIVIEGTGDMIIADTTLGLIDVPRSSPAINFPTPTVVGTLDATDDPENLTVQSSGNIVTDLTLSATSANPSISTTAFLLGTAPTGACPILAAGGPVTPADAFDPGEVCTYAIDFKPTVVGLNSANLVLATSAAGGALTSTNTVPLTGIGLSTIASFKLVAIPSVIDKGSSVELILTALQANGTSIATDYVGTVTFTTSDSTGIYLGGTTPGTHTTTYTFTAADNGVLTIPASSGLQLNQYGVYTASATDGTYSATSNNIFVVEPSTLTLTSSVNPSLIGQSTTFTLNISTTGTVTPGGTVTFYSNGVEIGSVSVSGSAASINDSFAASGTYAITATYHSDTFTHDGTASLTQVVGNATAVTLTSSVNPSLVNQPTLLTATITALASPTGTLTFFNGGTPIATVPVVGATVSLPISFATAGTYPLTAVFTSTDPSVTGATSPILSQRVENVAQLALTSSVNPSLVNQSTTLTATLTALGTPAGSVTFYDGTTPIGTAPLTGTSASISTSFSTTGTHTLKAVYTSGNTLTERATSPTLQQIVLNASTVILRTSVNPVLVNANTTLTATVTSAGTPTGTVTFKSNGVVLGTATISGGTATLVVSFPTAGVYTLTAVYNGDGNNQTATSPPISQTVLNIATVALAMTSSINPILLDNPTILTAVLTSTGPTPTGTVSFFDSGAPIGTGELVNGTVSISASFVYAATHTITASYSGDAVTAPANSPALSQIVADFALTVASGSSSTGSMIAGGTATYALVLTPLITSTLPSAVTITVTGLPSTATGFLNPVTIAAGSGTTPIAFSVTAAQILAAIHNPPPPAHRSPVRYAPIALALMALPLAWFRRRKRFGSLFASICLLLALTAGLTGCISSPATGYYGQTPNTYNLTVTATSGNLARSTYLTLTIQ